MKKYILLVIRIILGTIFIYASVGKIFNPAEFAHDIDNYRMLPYLLVSFMAIILPWVEFIAGLMLIFGRFLHGSSFILMVLNLVFIFAIASALVRGLNIDCGCFSLKAGASKVGIVRLIEDVIFFVMAAVVFWDANRAESQHVAN